MAHLAHIYTKGVIVSLFMKFHFPHISRSSVISQINWDQAWSGQILICAGLLITDLACEYTKGVITSLVTKYYSTHINRSSDISQINWDQAWSGLIQICAGLLITDLACEYSNSEITSLVTRFHVPCISRSSVISQINCDQIWSGQLLICAGLLITDLARKYTKDVVANLVTKFHFPHISRSLVISMINWDQLWSVQILICVGLWLADLAYIYTEGVYAGHVMKFHFLHISRSSVISQINRDQAWSG